MTFDIRKEYIPRAYAPDAIKFMLEHQRCALFAGMGMGKTSMVYTMLDQMYMLSLESRPTLVLGPKRVARDTWPEEVLKWKHLRDIDVVNIGGTVKQRKQALMEDAAVYTANYEQLPWLLEHLDGKFPWGVVVADESTRLKSFRLQQGGKRAAALAKVAHTQVNRWINLTGTPAPNGLIDLWGQTWFLDQGHRLGRTFGAFKDRWFYRKPSGGQFAGPLVPHKHSEAQIHAAIKDICMTLDPADWFDIEKPIVTTLKVSLPPDVRKMYKQLEKEMFVKLADDAHVEAFNAAALTNKCLQLANGAVYTDDKGKWSAVHDAKLDALESVVEEANGMPVLVAYNFISDKERIMKKFPKAVLLSEKAGMAKFKAGHAPIGLAHPKSMGHGIDGLQTVTNILVRFGHDWNLEERMQMLERIGPVRQKQAGLDRPVMVYDIVADGTVDNTVIERHETKREVQDLLLEAMKRSGPAIKF